MYFFSFVRNIFSKTYYILSVRRLEARWASSRVKELESALGGRLDDFTFRKIVNSYAIYNPMMCDAFTALRGRASRLAEKERMLQYFICSSLFDNFCDRKELSQDALYQISFAPESFTAASFDEQLFLQAHLFLRDGVQDKPFYEEVMHGLFQSQVDSIKQFDHTIGDEEIGRITLSKGGYAVLLCHFYLDDAAGEAERQCWYQIGGIIQLINDLYDIHKDYQEGAATLPNRMNDAYAFHTYFTGLVENVKKEISNLPFPAEAKQHLTISMMGICSLGMMAIRQLQQIQGMNATLPDLRSLPRKALIVDMEKPKNLWYCIRLVYQHARPLTAVG